MERFLKLKDVLYRVSYFKGKPAVMDSAVIPCNSWDFVFFFKYVVPSEILNFARSFCSLSRPESKQFEESQRRGQGRPKRRRMWFKSSGLLYTYIERG